MALSSQTPSSLRCPLEDAAAAHLLTFIFFLRELFWTRQWEQEEGQDVHRLTQQPLVTGWKSALS